MFLFPSDVDDLGSEEVDDTLSIVNVQDKEK